MPPFDASGPLNVDLHHHEGKDLRHPARASGRLPVAPDQDCGWMGA